MSETQPPKFSVGEEAIICWSTQARLLTPSEQSDNGKTVTILKCDYVPRRLWYAAGYWYTVDLYQNPPERVHEDSLRKKPKPSDQSFDDLMKGIKSPTKVFY